MYVYTYLVQTHTAGSKWDDMRQALARLEYVALCRSMLHYVAEMRWHESCVEVYYSVLHCVKKIENDNKIFLTYIRDMCNNALQCVAVRCNVLKICDDDGLFREGVELL